MINILLFIGIILQKKTTFTKVIELVIQIDVWLFLNLIKISLIFNISTNKILFTCRKHRKKQYY